MADDPPGVLSGEDLARICARLEQIAEDRTVLDGVDQDTRLRLLRAAGLVSRPDRDHIRAGRRARMLRLKAEKRKKDVALFDTTKIRSTLRMPVYVAPQPEPAASKRERLAEPRRCYVCKSPFDEVHDFYDSMCPPCAQLSYEMRFPKADLAGRVALVTGARLKIGFHTALMLLRQGARVIATTRFPRDAAQRFAAAEDFAKWSDRLHVYGLDLRHIPSVELFASHLAARYPHLDVLVNNAAQTVRRPAAFYAHMLALESKPHDELPRRVAHDPRVASRARRRGRRSRRRVPVRGLAAGERAGARRLSRRARGPRPHAARRRSPSYPAATRKRAPRSSGLAPKPRPCFRKVQLDVDLQQVDLRAHNSWRMRAGDVPTGELLEVHLVNAIAPFVLCAGLRPMLERSPHAARFIVNVSAMEAQFSRNKKTDKHPHTNMAKASLNMLTRTSAADYARSRIYMNSVDTGWVTDEDPLHHAQRKQAVHDFHPPLDIVDGAARVLAPIFTSLHASAPPYGIFFKDYRPVSW